ncbi:MAG TPA: hypothetical protein VJW77_13245 [Terriglobia bacterium]|nr:hypothetical protein [Terriglobia bacterium]HKT12782.1 hypothetical protein [Terriglobia bacterium]
MSGITYTLLEYLAWVSLGLALIVVIFACVSIALSISSAAHLLIMKWNIFRNTRHPRAARRAV